MFAVGLLVVLTHRAVSELFVMGAWSGERQKSYIVTYVSLSKARSFSASNVWLLGGPVCVNPRRAQPQPALRRKPTPTPGGGPSTANSREDPWAAGLGVYIWLPVLLGAVCAVYVTTCVYLHVSFLKTPVICVNSGFKEHFRI